MKIFLESQKETSKLSRNVFWGRWDHLVAQKSNFKIFFFENDVNSRTPPLLTYLRDICILGSLGSYGFTEIQFKIFFFEMMLTHVPPPPLLTFLRDM